MGDKYLHGFGFMREASSEPNLGNFGGTLVNPSGNRIGSGTVRDPMAASVPPSVPSSGNGIGTAHSPSDTSTMSLSVPGPRAGRSAGGASARPPKVAVGGRSRMGGTTPGTTFEQALSGNDARSTPAAVADRSAATPPKTPTTSRRRRTLDPTLVRGGPSTRLNLGLGGHGMKDKKGCE